MFFGLQKDEAVNEDNQNMLTSFFLKKDYKLARVVCLFVLNKFELQRKVNH